MLKMLFVYLVRGDAAKSSLTHLLAAEPEVCKYDKSDPNVIKYCQKFSLILPPQNFCLNVYCPVLTLE